MLTHLETLSETHKAEAQADVLRLQASRDRLEILRRVAETRQLLEHSDPWASEDPLQGGQAIPAGLGAAPNDLFHYPALGRHNARPGSRRDGAQPPYFWTEMQHWLIVDAARTIEGLCPTAVNILDVLEQFAIFTGFTYKIVQAADPESKLGEEPVEEADDGKPETREAGDVAKPLAARLKDFKAKRLAAKVQKFLDRWMKDNEWPEWEKEVFRRTRRDGESFVTIDLDHADGLNLDFLRLHAKEPEQIRDPLGVTSKLNSQIGITGRDASWKFGILTSKEDTSKPIKYNVVSQYSATQQQHVVYEAKEVWHVKINVEKNTKRGVSDFFAGMNDFPRVRKLLRYLAESATAQASVAWVEEMAEGMMPTPMGDMNITTRTGQNASAMTQDGPTIIRTEHGRKYTAGPLAGTGQSETLISVLQAALRNIGSRWQFPEGLVSGDASNANLASALVAEAPFVRAMESRQWFYRAAYIALLERIIQAAALVGLLPEGENILEEIEISVEMPPVVPRKAKEETERNVMLLQNGVISVQTVSAREDLDFEDEQQNIAEHPIEPPSIMLGLPEEEIPEGEADDDTAGESSTATDGGGKSTTGSSRKKKRGLGAKGSTSTTGASGTNERVS